MATERHCKKLIEVSLPLETINVACVEEKFIRTGHPANLHQWWSRKPLVAARAVLFASLVDDPSAYLDNENGILEERERLFRILEQLARWENSGNQSIMDKARLEIARSLSREKDLPVPVGRAAVIKFLHDHAPTVMDPFAGGGSIPLEAQRLGLPAHASDLNPVSVLVNRAMIEIPARFTDRPAVHQAKTNSMKNSWTGIEGLVEDVEFYGNWIQKEAEKRLKSLFPKVRLPYRYGSGEATVVAWIWAHAIHCPNPACGTEMPLASKWELSKKKGKETWIQPVVDNSQKPPRIRYTIVSGKGKQPDGTVDRRGATCFVCGNTVPLEHIRAEAKAGKLSNVMIGIAAEGRGGRIYLEPDEEQIQAALSAKATWKPEQAINPGLAGNVTTYGFATFGDLFLPRQLVALTTICELIREVRGQIEKDALTARFAKDDCSLSTGGTGAKAYSQAVITYLSFALSKTLNRSNGFVPWGINVECPVNLFSRQTIAFIWDFAESNVIFGPSGSFSSMLDNTLRALEKIDFGIPRSGSAKQSDAASAGRGISNLLISTDPPYYDVISYSDLSDFFYVWLRPLLEGVFPDIFSTMLAPKTQELIADLTRSGSKEQAKVDFETGMFRAFSHFKEIINYSYPLTVYYAYKQTEEKGSDEKVSTGWETILSGIVNAGFVITGTWPMRTERAVKTSSLDANVLASSIVLVCRPRSDTAETIQHKDFLSTLNRELPAALKQLQQGNIAPVDLAQAAIGPGMAVFSRYHQVLESNGNLMSVRTALGLINQTLDQYFAEQEGDYDGETRWALSWFEQYGYEEGPYGIAETLSKAKNISVQRLTESGILEARSGKVHLLRRDELMATWNPKTDPRITTWEVVQHLVLKLDKEGEQPAANLLQVLGADGDAARDLVYRLYNFCERKKWAQDALAYNMLAVAWPRLKDLTSHNKAFNQESLL